MLSTRLSLQIGLLAAALCLGGCDEASSPLNERLDLLAPHAINDHVVFIDKKGAQAFVVNVTDAELNTSPSRVALPQGVRSATSRNGHSDQLLILAAGAGATSESPERAALTVLDSSGIAESYEFDSTFNVLSQSSDGRFVILSYSENATSESMLFNPLEIAIIDLDVPFAEGTNPRLRTLRSFGDSPKKVIFSPEMTITGETRRLAVVLFDRDVALLDLGDTTLPDITVPVSESRSLGLSQVEFDTVEGQIYLRGDSSDDIYVLSLVVPDASRVNAFQPSRTQLDGGSNPEDIALYRTGDDESRVISVSSFTATIIDAGTSRTYPIGLDSAASRVLLFNGESPFDANLEERALFYKPGSQSLSFLDLDDAEERGHRNLQTLTGLQGSYSKLIPLADNTALLIHTGTGLSLLDMDERTVTPIGSSQSLGDATFDAAHQTLWLAPQGSNTIGFLDLTNSHPGEVALDDTIDNFVMVPSETAPKLVLTHDTNLGYMTILNASDPGSSPSALRGYFLDGVLQ